MSPSLSHAAWLWNGVDEKWPLKSHCLIEKHTQPRMHTAQLVDNRHIHDYRQFVWRQRMKMDDIRRERRKNEKKKSVQIVLKLLDEVKRNIK